ncbi:MAG: MinD/ParA family protein [Promethearchaeota archaeon]
MVLKSLGLFSHKGGVGKTIIAVNLGVQLAKEGKCVCLLDCDFHGPSIMTFFKPKTNLKWLNDHLLREESIDDCLQDFSTALGLPGKLLIAFADPSTEAIQQIIRIDQPTSYKILENLIRLKKVLEETYKIEYLIIDSSPGAGYSTVNSMLMVDSNLFVVKLSNADLIGTSLMITSMHKELKQRSLVIANQIPKKIATGEKTKRELQQLIEARFTHDMGDKSAKFLGWLPTDYKLQTNEFNEAMKTLRGEETSRVIYTLTHPEHIFSTTCVELVPILFGENQ